MPRNPRLVLIASCLTILSVGENSTAIMAALPAMPLVRWMSAPGIRKQGSGIKVDPDP